MGSILGSAYLGKLPCRFRKGAVVEVVQRDC